MHKMGRISIDAIQHTTIDCAECPINPQLLRSLHTLAEIRDLADLESTNVLSLVFNNFNFKKGHAGACLEVWWTCLMEEHCPTLSMEENLQKFRIHIEGNL